MTATTAGNASFTAAFAAGQAPEEAFRAISNVRGWWPGDIQGGTGKAGGEFTRRYHDAHRCPIKATGPVPGERAARRVPGNYSGFTRGKSERENTEIRFEITARDGKTGIGFTHAGLVPDYECFDVCSNAWNFYLFTSLRALIRTGRGLPDRKEQAASA